MPSKDPATTDQLLLSAIRDAARRPRPVWRSERTYVLATIAGIVGLGNLWRFPAMVGRHGGGAFLAAYVVCVLAVAVPLAALESACGGLARRSPVGLFRRAAGRVGAVVGWATVAMTVVILSYYFVITGWTLGYAMDAILARLRPFTEFTEGYTTLWLFLLVGGAVYVVLGREVAAIERASTYLVPVLVIMVVGLAVQGQTLDGAAEARSFYAGVSGEALTDPTVWRAAAGQAFYSVGVGQGILIAYGSFVPAGTNLLRSTMVIASANGLVSIISGLMVFAVAFTFDIPPSTGTELSFTAFPRAFAELPAGGVLAVVFFGLLFLAGFTSCLSGSVVVLSSLRDEWDLGRSAAARWTVGVIVVLGVPSALSFTDAAWSLADRPVLDRVDQLAGSGVIVVLGLAGALVLARRLPRRAVAASFGVDPVRIGRVTLGATTVISWAAIVPLVALALFVVGTVA
ncbi:MAG: sodium-dependent transporter [Actinomycetota bacterium]|nr:sodium-dependent transporter [Actinomycetota bacterium]